MKTYTKQSEEARLVIEHDGDAESPRANDNIGHFFTKEDRHKSPDGNVHPLYQIMVETADDAKDTANHIELMRAQAHKMFKESAPKDGNSHDEDLHVIEIHPIYRYEHGNVSYKRGTRKDWDASNCGFYFITAQSISGETHTAESIAKLIDAELIAKLIDAELEEYTQWCNGEVYAFTLYDENGVEEESCGGFYAIEDIREHLPEEWAKEKLEDYIKN